MPAINSEKSDVKMVILTSPGQANKTWYSYVKHNGHPKNKIIEGMLRRFKANPISKIAQVVQFYDNHTGNLIQKYTY
ncbi:hypothetical protein [uncultured Flavobacterium sp.]|uniref:hypothetical protein n=1 Tax=uncultured Flavobacterium sp. TaxID=165435 RepID=UPI0025D9005D|nr:hypothetical protein [uncultured Flavobacterium sp.]